MLFNTVQFGVFFTVVLALHFALPHRARRTLLLWASLLFYSLWTPAYLVLLLADVGVNYALLRAMTRSRRPRIQLTLACLFTLGLLAGFKYAAMAVETALPVLAALGSAPIALPDVFLPLGISFYSFQILSLTIDSYRGGSTSVPPFSRYLLYVAFFPQLIAGPIVRGHELLPQLKRGGLVTTERARRGVWLIGVGLGKKVVMADWLLAPFVDATFRHDALGSSPFALIGLYSFAFQIYFDFSGYTDMARGMALLLGFELPMNFSEPYLSRSPVEFWRRWHRTLSRWLADYLYVPLGGNRGTPSRTAANLMLTMLLGGLWHGASWTFVVWGGLHGLLLVAHRILGRRPVDLDAPLGWRDGPRILVVFHLTCLAWVFFRADSLASALAYLRSLFACENPDGWPLAQTAVVLLCALLHGGERYARTRLPTWRLRLGAGHGGAAIEGLVLGIVFALAILAAGAGGDFIYFQF